MPWLNVKCLPDANRKIGAFPKRLSHLSVRGGFIFSVRSAAWILIELEDCFLRKRQQGE